MHCRHTLNTRGTPRTINWGRTSTTGSAPNANGSVTEENVLDAPVWNRTGAAAAAGVLYRAVRAFGSTCGVFSWSGWWGLLIALYVMSPAPVWCQSPAGPSHAAPRASEIQFPWGCAECSPATPSAASYRLIQPATKESQRRPVELSPPKVWYSYGWFGRPAPTHWGRHFGASRKFTQWSQR